MTDWVGIQDYYTERDAAKYCCVSYSHFRANIKKYNLKPGNIWGKKVYRHADLQRLMETEGWPKEEIQAPPSNGESTNSNQVRSQRRPRLIGATGATSAASA